MNELKAEQESIGQTLDELREEQGGEDGLLAEVVDDRGGINRGAVAARLKVIKNDHEAADECKVLEAFAALLDALAEAGRKAKDAQAALTDKVINQYGKLTEADAKLLVVDDKWLATLTADVSSEMERVSQGLTGRLKELTERYKIPVTELNELAASLQLRVSKHLEKMGFKIMSKNTKQSGIFHAPLKPKDFANSNGRVSPHKSFYMRQ